MPDVRIRALKLLTRREYSRAELQARLQTEENSEAEIAAALDRLQEENLLSDERFARQRASGRGARYGNERLRRELQQRGVADGLIAEALGDAGDELARCRAVWERKFGCPPATPQERAKQMRFLQYRGFSGETVRRTLRGVDEA